MTGKGPIRLRRATYEERARGAPLTCGPGQPALFGPRDRPGISFESPACGELVIDRMPVAARLDVDLRCGHCGMVGRLVYG